MIDQCTNLKTSGLFTLIDESGEISHNMDSDTIFVNKPGKYKLFVDIDVDPISLNFIGNETKRDTFYTEKITHSHYVSNPPKSEYLVCGLKADGAIVDYFYNGKIRQLGYFKNGQLSGIYNKYFYSGNIKEISYKRKSKWYHEEYYYNGKKMSSVGNIDGYVRKEFYFDGQIEVLETEKQLSRFDSVGRLKSKLTWKSITGLTWFKKDKREKLQYTLNLFDNSEKNTLTIIFESFGLQEKIAIDSKYAVNFLIDKYGFSSVILFDNGIEAVKLVKSDDYPPITQYLNVSGNWKKDKNITNDELQNILAHYQ